MKPVLSLTVIFVVSLCIVHAQESPPPPPAVSKPSAELPPPPRAAAVKLWESEDGGFKVRFPAAPKVSVTEGNSSFGKTSITSVAISTTFAYYGVTYLDFPTDMTDKYDLNIRFDMMRDEQAKRASARVMEDAEYTFGSHYGRMNVFETATETVSRRTFVAGPRLFMLIVGTKGKQSTLSERVATGNRSRIDSFFNSFELTRVPAAKSKAVKLPADFGVKSDDKSFHSSFLGLSLTPPEKWKLSDQENAEFVLELGKDLIKRTRPQLAAALTNENARVLALFSKSAMEETASDAMMFIFAEQAPYPNFLPDAVAKSYEKLYLDSTEKVTKPVSQTIIGGKPFAWLETFDSADKTYNRLYFCNVGGISFEVMFIYKEPSDLGVLLRSLDTIRFVDKTR